MLHPLLSRLHKEIFTLAHEVIFDRISMEDVAQLLNSHSEDPTNGELMELQEHLAPDGQETGDTSPLQMPRKMLSLKLLTRSLQTLTLIDSDLQLI